MPETDIKMKGYRALDRSEMELISKVDSIGEEIESLCLDLASREEIDKRWLSFATSALQKGVMFLVRSIARPAKF